mgnify:FL=1
MAVNGGGTLTLARTAEGWTMQLVGVLGAKAEADIERLASGTGVDGEKVGALGGAEAGVTGEVDATWNVEALQLLEAAAAREAASLGNLGLAADLTPMVKILATAPPSRLVVSAGTGVEAEAGLATGALGLESNGLPGIDDAAGQLGATIVDACATTGLQAGAELSVSGGYEGDDLYACVEGELAGNTLAVTDNSEHAAALGVTIEAWASAPAAGAAYQVSRVRLTLKSGLDGDTSAVVMTLSSATEAWNAVDAALGGQDQADAVVIGDLRKRTTHQVDDPDVIPRFLQVTMPIYDLALGAIATKAEARWTVEVEVLVGEAVVMSALGTDAAGLDAEALGEAQRVMAADALGQNYEAEGFAEGDLDLDGVRVTAANLTFSVRGAVGAGATVAATGVKANGSVEVAQTAALLPQLSDPLADADLLLSA